MEKELEERILNNSHIPTDEVINDIRDTQTELDELQELLSVYIKDRQKNRFDIIKCEVGIEKRIEFIDFLNQILKYREKNEGRNKE